MGYSVITMSAKNEKTNIKVSHIRRCHVCGTVNESENSAVHKCGSCGKHLATFYYFDESKLVGVSDSQLFLTRFKDVDNYNLMYGFSHYWEE